jgi:hypothetical protein
MYPPPPYPFSNSFHTATYCCEGYEELCQLMTWANYCDNPPKLTPLIMHGCPHPRSHHVYLLGNQLSIDTSSVDHNFFALLESYCTVNR